MCRAKPTSRSPLVLATTTLAPIGINYIKNAFQRLHGREGKSALVSQIRPVANETLSVAGNDDFKIRSEKQARHVETFQQ